MYTLMGEEVDGTTLFDIIETSSVVGGVVILEKPPVFTLVHGF
jgi:hypothetical protein